MENLLNYLKKKTTIYSANEEKLLELSIDLFNLINCSWN